jgi:MYXO-CTERM domain-containing protein
MSRAIVFRGIVAWSVMAAFAVPTSAGFSWTVDKQEWLTSVPSYTKLDFVLPGGEVLGEQYAALGVHFPDGNDVVVANGSFDDLWGVKGGFFQGPDIHLTFDTAQQWIAIDFPGSAIIDLYSQGSLVYSSPQFGQGFLGLIGTTTFDEARIISPFGSIHVDNIYFGAPIPGPAPMALVALAALTSRRRRRDVGRS